MTPNPLRNPQFATTLAHGLALLNCFKVSDAILSNKDFAERTGLSKATVSRLTYTLAMLGFLRYDNNVRKYRLGSAAVSVGYPFLQGLRIRELARPLMRELADVARGSVSLGIRDRTQMVYVETARGHESPAFRPDTGASLPILASAMGRAWLGRAEPAQRAAVIEQVQTRDPAQWDAYHAGLEGALRTFAECDVALGEGDIEREIHAVAVPMREPINSETFVFNCGVPRLQLTDRTLVDVIAPRLVAMVDTLERQIASQNVAADETRTSPSPLPEQATMDSFPDDDDRQFAFTLARGLEILRCFRPGEAALGNKDFVARTGLSKATVSRLAYTLTELGYLRHDEVARNYRLGGGVLSMGYPLLAGMRIRQIARPFMRELALQVRGSVSLGMRDQSNMVYIECCPGDKRILARPDVGAVRPILRMAMGRAWLAAVTPQEREVALNRLRIGVPDQWQQYGAQVQQALHDFHETGVCFSYGDMQKNAYGVAAPLCAQVDAETLVFNCAVPAQSSQGRRLIDDIAPQLVTMVSNVEIAAGLR
ncbi:IclR family transcriptional regulator [Paraburkholderia sp. RP-4-7]|uniref:IclR family transcriptional regulator n=1 Tax=Paraburkholderia polaris TaxID=2728848 RepID=A0A848IYN4_9BURK|nr:IclR family transcriptional regulator [Paraburkholderia polaris]NMM04057.1 IclR family transcriptional regulator [Paraburkholderia polaris]